MQNQNLPLVPPLQAPDAAQVSAQDLIELIAGTSAVEMQGFPQRKAHKGFWSHPNMPFTTVQDAERDVQLIQVRARRWRQLVPTFLGVGLLMAGFAAGHLFGVLSVSIDPGVASPWQVAGVAPGGVLVKMNNRTDLVPVGARMPNGELVLAVNPDRGIAVLESSSLMVREARTRAEGNTK